MVRSSFAWASETTNPFFEVAISARRASPTSRTACTSGFADAIAENVLRETHRPAWSATKQAAPHGQMEAPSQRSIVEQSESSQQLPYGGSALQAPSPFGVHAAPAHSYPEPH
jgi:hypothetical protein